MFDWLKRSIAKRAVRQAFAKGLKNAEDSLHRADQDLRAAACEATYGKLLLPFSGVSGPSPAYVIALASCRGTSRHPSCTKLL